MQVSATIGAYVQEVEILRPEGTLVRDVRPMTRVNISVIVEKNGRRESGSAGGGGRIRLDGLITRDHWQGSARGPAHRHRQPAAVPAPAGVMDVVLGPGWPGILLHEAVGHGLGGRFQPQENQSPLPGLMGQRVAAPGVTVLDDGTIPDRRGSLSVDDEGTPSGKKRADRGRNPGRLHAGPPERTTNGG